ncbi:hypothetical protein E2C01_077684 [Portunus trituberculatus]|uniref:Uncharacterized protein n=1 Tax=Portunus trituberculatus TaxID=210409 RepID=A0A5B7IKX6_PORTR|nr:hypothetical protein [Portunus trituberculatus]
MCIVLQGPPQKVCHRVSCTECVLHTSTLARMWMKSALRLGRSSMWWSMKILRSR